MLQTAQRTAKSKTKKVAPPHDRFLEAFRWMLLARTLEEKLVSLYRGGLITGGVYIGKGQSAKARRQSAWHVACFCKKAISSRH
jgi:TPP-dependent pyruvate/acetoin dehydrogenase alpha subunit